MPPFDPKAADQLTNLLRAEHYFGTYETCIDMGWSHADALQCARAVSGIGQPERVEAAGP